MSANAMTLENVQVANRTWLETLHDWLTTVDHKRIGILYILLALFFLVVGGVEAIVIRIQLMHPQNHFVSPQVFNRMFTMHGTTMIFYVAIPHHVWVCELFSVLDDWCAGHGFSPAQRDQFLADAAERAPALLQSCWWKRAVRRRECTGYQLVGVCSAGRKSFLARSQLRLPDSLGPAFGIWQRGDGCQSHCHYSLHALPRQEADSYASVGLA
jgi:hypothetical protein